MVDKMLLRKCKNCSKIHYHEKTSFCSTNCFDEWVGKLISNSILAAARNELNELVDTLIEGQLRRNKSCQP